MKILVLFLVLFYSLTVFADDAPCKEIASGTCERQDNEENNDYSLLCCITKPSETNGFDKQMSSVITEITNNAEATEYVIKIEGTFEAEKTVELSCPGCNIKIDGASNGNSSTINIEKHFADFNDIESLEISNLNIIYNDSKPVIEIGKSVFRHMKKMVLNEVGFEINPGRIILIHDVEEVEINGGYIRPSHSKFTSSTDSTPPSSKLVISEAPSFITTKSDIPNFHFAQVCESNNDCNSGLKTTPAYEKSYCYKGSCDDEIGFCHKKPSSCGNYYNPVRTCDDQVKSNACEAAKEGLNVDGPWGIDRQLKLSDK